MAVVGVLVEAVVGHQHEVVADLVAHRAQRDLDDAVGASAPEPAGVLRWRARRRGSPPGRRGRRAPAPPCGGSPGCAGRRPASRRPAPARRCPPSRTGAPRGRRPRAAPRRRGDAAPGYDAAGGGRWSGNAMQQWYAAPSPLHPRRLLQGLDDGRRSVGSAASMSTRRPRVRAVSEVTGPIDTTRGCGSGSVPTASRKFVDRRRRRERDRVDLARLDPPRPRRSRARPRIVRYTASTSTLYPRSVRPSGSTSRACSARASSTRSPGTAGRREHLEERLGDEALGHEVRSDAPGSEDRRGARPDRGDPTPPSARLSSPAGVSPRSKNALTALVDVNTIHAYCPSSGSANATGSTWIAGSSSTSAPSASSRATSSLACSRARVTTIVRPKSGRRLEPGELERRDLADDDRRRAPARIASPIVASVARIVSLVRHGCRCGSRRPACRVPDLRR